MKKILIYLLFLNAIHLQASSINTSPVLSSVSGWNTYIATDSLNMIGNNIINVDNIYLSTSTASSNITLIDGFFNFNVSCASGSSVFTHDGTVGIENQSMIFIDDNRTGTTSNEEGEASLVIDSEGLYGLQILDGKSQFIDLAEFYTGILTTDNQSSSWGTGGDFNIYWHTNSAADDITGFGFDSTAGESMGILLHSATRSPVGMTDVNGITAPTFCFTNINGADLKDYSGVHLGHRDQNDVTETNYFYLWGMTGAFDGIVDPTSTEIVPSFMIGASSDAVKTPSAPNGSTIITDWLQLGTSGNSVPQIVYDVNYSTQAYRIEVISDVLTATKVD